MKRIITALLAAALLLCLLCGCSVKEVAENVGLANPVTEGESVEDINNAAGCAIKSMKDHYSYDYSLVSDESFSVIKGEPIVAQYSFKLGGIPVCIRAGHSQNDISGIYMDGGKHPADCLDQEKYYDPIDTGAGIWTRWFLGGMQYCLTVGDGKDYSLKMDQLSCANLAELTLYLRDYFSYEMPWYMEPYYTYEYEDYEGEEGWEFGYDYGYINEADYVYSEEKLPYKGAVEEYEELCAKNASFGTDFGRGLSVPFASLENYKATQHENVVKVDNIDDFLAAIAPDTEIILAPGTYNISDAKNYGKEGGEYYCWTDTYDGFQLEIERLSNFAVTGSVKNGEPAVLISTDPRYAAVFRFCYCSDIELAGLTVGHTEGLEGYCTGSVLSFSDCAGTSITGCELYGCGCYGIDAISSSGFAVNDCVIRGCTCGHVYMTCCDDVSFTACSFLSTYGFSGSYYYGCGEIAYKDCDFAGNRLREMFLCEGTDSLTLTNAFIVNNDLAAGIFNGTSVPYTIDGGAVVELSNPDSFSDIAFG